MNEEYKFFFKKCVIELGVDRIKCKMKSNYCRIRTAKGWVVHYEWWLAQNNNLKVCLHFESQKKALNQSRYCKCATLVDTLKNNVDKNSSVTAGARGEKGYHITISRYLDFNDRSSVNWAVSMMRVLQEVFSETVESSRLHK